jgi:hypothetical protein
MNLKNMTVALIAVLIYEAVLKLTHVLTPSLHEVASVAYATDALRLVTGLILIIFLYLFYREERAIAGVDRLMKPLLFCIVLSVLLRLPVLRGTLNIMFVRVLSQLIGLVISVLLFLLVLAYRSSVPAGREPLRQAATLVVVTFGIGIATALMKFAEITLFAVSGSMTVHSPMFFNLMFVVFLITHAAVIYFLYRYYQFEFGAPGQMDR